MINSEETPIAVLRQHLDLDPRRLSAVSAVSVDSHSLRDGDICMMMRYHRKSYSVGSLGVVDLALSVR